MASSNSKGGSLKKMCPLISPPITARSCCMRVVRTCCRICHYGMPPYLRSPSKSSSDSATSKTAFPGLRAELRAHRGANRYQRHYVASFIHQRDTGLHRHLGRSPRRTPAHDQVANSARWRVRRGPGVVGKGPIRVAIQGAPPRIQSRQQAPPPGATYTVRRIDGHLQWPLQMHLVPRCSSYKDRPRLALDDFLLLCQRRRRAISLSTFCSSCPASASMPTCNLSPLNSAVLWLRSPAPRRLPKNVTANESGASVPARYR